MSFVTQHERPEDHNPIINIHRQAFARDNEGRLVHRLRREQQLLLSMIVADNDQPIAHIAFSPVTLSGSERAKSLPTGVALGPVGVLPSYQGQGIGLNLIQAALDSETIAATPWQVLVGEPSLYGRFGFDVASKYGLKCEFKLPPEYFLLRVTPAAEVPLFEQGETLHYHSAFHSV
ncbi:N-acetyltransferase [Neiella marina]|uniref:N-acetyltransferase n=1 Tax=Neiella holothuriorum TaxID=2870530 RepID=A0ABS7EEL9_9GAMM|nr:N-acetyltransferase [Neiella holothuriorum]MBW8190132.1 N-acetyltransferase [Neiella holothuriorum]